MINRNTDDAGIPKRNVSKENSIGCCNHCGGNANNTLSGEHIWKCSKVVPIEQLQELVEKWKNDADIFLDPDDENIHSSERAASLQQLSCAEQIESLCEQHMNRE